MTLNNFIEEEFMNVFLEISSFLVPITLMGLGAYLIQTTPKNKNVDILQEITSFKSFKRDGRTTGLTLIILGIMFLF